MKKNIILLLAAFFLIFSVAEAQLQMNSSGNIGLGISPSSTEKVRVYGDIKFDEGEVALIMENGIIKFRTDDAYPSPIIFDSWDEEPRIKPTDDGIGFIGTSINSYWKMYTEYLNVDDVQVTSDIRQKENIRELNNSLSNILKVRGIKYDLISKDQSNWNEYKISETERLRKNKIGFVAQELMEVYPELVKHDKEIDQYSINYLGMIPILVEAIKEQQDMIDGLQNEIHALQNDANLKSASITGNPEGSMNETEDALMQNSPNPFSESTEILFSISEETQNAALNVYNLSGTQLKSIELYQRGEGSITISGGEFDPGIYLYTLITDEKVIDTKQMVLTKN